MKKLLLVFTLSVFLINFSYADTTTVTCGRVGTKGAVPCSCPSGRILSGIEQTDPDIGYGDDATYVSALHCSSIPSTFIKNKVKLFNDSRCPDGWALDENHNNNYADHLYCKKQ